MKSPAPAVPLRSSASAPWRLVVGSGGSSSGAGYLRRGRHLAVLTRRWFLQLLFSLATLTPAFAEPARLEGVVVVVNERSGVYEDIVRHLEQRVPVDGEGLAVVSLAGPADLADLVDGATAIITIGTRAAEAVYRVRPSVPVLSALITASGFNYLAEQHYGSVDGALDRGVWAIYLDQPLERLYRLGMQLVPDATRIAILTSDLSVLEPGGQAWLNHGSGPAIDIVRIGDDSGPINVLNPVMKRSDFVIAMPGKKSVTVSTARWILHIGSHTRTPVIAFSKKYVQSGALAAVYTSPGDIARQVLRVMDDTQSLRLGPSRTYPPGEFSVGINRTVARILGIELQEEAHYREQIELTGVGP